MSFFKKKPKKPTPIEMQPLQTSRVNPATPVPKPPSLALPPIPSPKVNKPSTWKIKSSFLVAEERFWFRKLLLLLLIIDNCVTV